MSEAAVAYRAGNGPVAPAGRRLWLVAEPRAGYGAAPRAEVAVTTGCGADSDEATRVDAGEALAALARAADLMARADLAALDDRGLLEHTAAVDRQVTRLEAARARALGAVDRRQATSEDGCVTTASWLRWRTRRDFAQATRMAVTARRLSFLPEAWAALKDGAITMAHAEAIAHAAIPQRRAAVVEHEPTLVELVRRALPRDVRRACARIADQVDPDGADGRPSTGSGGGPDPRRHLHAARLFEGLGDLRATLDPVTFARLEALLHALDLPDPPDTPESERRTPGQRRHDAFDRILRAAEEHPNLPTVHGARPHALLLIDLLALLGRDHPGRPEGSDRTDGPHGSAGGGGRSGSGGPVPRTPRLGTGAELDLARALELLDEASLTPVLMLGPWRVVGVGRRHRTLPTWLRPLLTMIHGHCRGPGCDRPIAWTDAAHLAPWAAGADTHLDHTIPACPGHHELMDQLGWHVTLDPDTAICTWSSPDGRTILRTHPPDP